MKVHWGLLSVALGLLSSHGNAQSSPQKVAADTAFDEGKRLMDKGDFPTACARFAESQRLDPASSTLIWLGTCFEKTGQLASAWSTFREAAALAAQQGRSDREKLAREHVAALEPRLSKVSFSAQSHLAGMILKLDDVEIGQALWGTPIPIDAGPHQLRVHAPGFQEAIVPFRIEKSSKIKEIILPTLIPVSPAASTKPANPPAPTSVPSAEPSVSSSAPESSPAVGYPGESGGDPGAFSGRQIGGLILGGTGLILGGIGGLGQLDAQAKARDARGQHNRALYDEANRQQTLSISGIFLGGAMLAGGIVLFLLPVSRSSSVSGISSTQLSLRGSFFSISGNF